MNRILHFLGLKDGQDVGFVLASGAIGSFIVKTLGVGALFLSQVCLARMMGAQNYGQYIYVLTWMNFLVLAGKAGFDIASVRYVAAYHGVGEWGLLKGFLRRGSQIAMTASMLISLLAALCVWFFRNAIGHEFAGLFWISFLILPVAAFSAILGAYLLGLKRVVLAQAPTQIFTPLLLTTGVFVIWLSLDKNPGALAVMTTHLVTGVMVFMALAWLWRASLPGKMAEARPLYRTKEWSHTALSMFLIVGLFGVVEHAGVIIVGAFHGSTAAGIYSAASKVAALTAFGLIVMNTIAAPMISQLYSGKRFGELQRVVSLTALGSFLIAAPTGLALLLFRKEILELFGEEFSSGQTALLIMTAGQLINALAGPVGNFMIMTDREREMVWVMGGSAVLSLSLNLILIPFYGMEGAAVAGAVTMIVWNIGLALYISRRFKINVTIFSWFMKKKEL